LLFFVLLVGVVLRGIDILQPYENGHRGACAAFFALMANNHLKHGLLTTGGVGILNPVWAPPEFFNYYLHHPPGSVLIATVGAALSGANPSGLRLIFLPLSIGIALLVLRLARTRDPRVGLVAFGVACVMPLMAYYGAFVNFEIPTLFFILLALFLYLRYERRGRSKDRWRYLAAQVAAVGCDWIALGLPLCLLVLAPFHRRRTDSPADARSPRPLAKTAALGFGVGVATVIAVKAWYAIQLSRYGVDPDGGSGLGYYLAATPLVPQFSFDLWRERLTGFALKLITLPVLVLSALGLLIVTVRAFRRNLAQIDVAAITLTTIGIANVIILGEHALKHDYYLLYLGPACALLVAIVFRWLFIDLCVAPDSAGSRVILAGALILIVATGSKANAVIESRRNYDQAVLGKNIANHTDPNAVVLLANDATAQVAVQANRFVVVSNQVRNLVQLTNARSFALRFGMKGRPLVLVVGRDQTELLAPDLATWLAKNATPRESGPFLLYDLGTLEYTPP
jgi:4-amino-4-deoxy-L-arabinose transferase-like glycosyltransferase